MATLDEGRHAGEFILSEGNFHISRENVTIDNGADLAAGTVLGKNTASGKYTALDLVSTGGGGGPPPRPETPRPAAAASAEVAAAVIARDAEVNGKTLTWPDGISDPDKATAIAQLAALHIIVR
jgi:hypothetical protein